MRTDIEKARLILEGMSYLDGRENIGACRADIIEAHRLLGDALVHGSELTISAEKVCALFRAKYLSANEVGEQLDRAVWELAEALK